MKEKFTTKIIVTSTRVTSSGRTRSGGDYHLWQVIATKPSGEPITLNLRAFEELPTNEVIEVDAELFRSENFGDSYTLKRKGGGGSGGGNLEKAVAELRSRVKDIEDFLTGRGEFRGTASQPATQAPPAAPPPAPPPTPPPAAPPPPVQPDPVAGGLPSDDDVPF